MSSWGGSACYPRSTFYPLSDGPSMRNHRITMLKIELIDFDKLNNNEIHNSLKRKRSIANYDLVKSEIGKLIAQFSKDKDLNNLISGVNKIAEKKNIQLFDRENIEINLQLNELDKFEDWFGSIGNNFRIQYIYSLLSTKYNI